MENALAMLHSPEKYVGFGLNECVDDLEESIPKHLSFSLANVEHPETYVSKALKSTSETQKLIDFKKGTTTLGFIIDKGVMIAVDSRASMGSFIASQTCRKIIEINDRILGTIAGGAADCSFWGRHLRRLCNLYELRNREPISTTAASNLLASTFFHYRGYGLSCGMMIAGFNSVKSQGELFYVDDSGSRIIGNLFSIGSGSTYAYGVLDSEYRFDMSLEEAVELCRRAIYHATFRDGGSGGVVRICFIDAKGWKVLEEGQDVMELHYKYNTR